MHPILRNILGFIAGLFIGSMVNMGLIMISGSIIPLPDGVDNSTEEGLKAGMHLFEPKHFIFPFLAHALGTFVGALVTALIAGSHKIKLGILIGLFFLAGGIYMVILLPAPLWFNLLDLSLAYLPMAYLGARLVTRKRK